ncbi:hypothetical protein EPN29_06710 [bacterium]|nr:MAG: hypothetical protein EPN29_06710 [bacterium]
MRVGDHDQDADEHHHQADDQHRVLSDRDCGARPLDLLAGLGPGRLAGGELPGARGDGFFGLLLRARFGRFGASPAVADDRPRGAAGGRRCRLDRFGVGRRLGRSRGRGPVLLFLRGRVGRFGRRRGGGEGAGCRCGGSDPPGLRRRGFRRWPDAGRRRRRRGFVGRGLVGHARRGGAGREARRAGRLCGFGLCRFLRPAVRLQRALTCGAHLVFDLRPSRRIHGALLHRLVSHDEQDRHHTDQSHGWSDEKSDRHRGRLSAIGACVTIAAVALFDRIQVQLVEARRQRNEVVLSTLSLLKSELVKASKEGGATGSIDDELVVRMARKEVKRREEAIDQYRKAGREESARREEAEMELLRAYLPAAMSAEEVEAEVGAVIADLKPQGPKAFGAVMKAATARLAGRAEGAQVAAAARKLLGS